MTTKDKSKDYRLRTKYGISLDIWNKMFEEQGKVCWICQRLPQSGILCVDHRHVKGYKKMSPEERALEVRGLLCFICNTTVGKLERRNRSREMLNRTVEYFKVFKMKGD